MRLVTLATACIELLRVLKCMLILSQIVLELLVLIKVAFRGFPKVYLRELVAVLLVSLVEEHGRLLLDFLRLVRQFVLVLLLLLLRVILLLLFLRFVLNERLLVRTGLTWIEVHLELRTLLLLLKHLLRDLLHVKVLLGRHAVHEMIHVHIHLSRHS